MQDAKTSALQTRAESREAKERDVEGDLSTIKQLQAEFNQLKAERGTIAALQTLLEPGRLTSPEMKAKVQNAVATAQALVNAIPGKSEVVTRILDQSNINFSASSPVQVFAGFLAEADKSTDLSDDEKAKIRRVIGQSEGDFQTGSDARNIARSKEQVIDPETGKVIGEKYLHDSPENMAELRPNLGTYMNGERMMLATKDGLITRDVTGWSGEDSRWETPLFVSMSNKEGWTVSGLQNFFKKLSRELGFRVNAYGFRRFVATAMSEKGVARDDMSRFLGHTRFTTTDLYIERHCRLTLNAGLAMATVCNG